MCTPHGRMQFRLTPSHTYELSRLTQRSDTGHFQPLPLLAWGVRRGYLSLIHHDRQGSPML